MLAYRGSHDRRPVCITEDTNLKMASWWPLTAAWPSYKVALKSTIWSKFYWGWGAPKTSRQSVTQHNQPKIDAQKLSLLSAGWAGGNYNRSPYITSSYLTTVYHASLCDFTLAIRWLRVFEKRVLRRKFRSKEEDCIIKGDEMAGAYSMHGRDNAWEEDNITAMNLQATKWIFD